MTKLVKCKALVACTEFVAGFGQVHMNPDDPDHAEVEIPAEAVARLVDDERVVVIDGSLDPLDHDGDGNPGGSLPGEQSTAAKGQRAKAAGKAPAKRKSRKPKAKADAETPAPTSPAPTEANDETPAPNAEPPATEGEGAPAATDGQDVAP